MVRASGPRQQSYEVLPAVLWEDPEEWLQQALHEDERGDEGWGAGQRPLWTKMPLGCKPVARYLDLDERGHRCDAHMEVLESDIA